MLVNDIVKHIGFIIPLNQVRLKSDPNYPFISNSFIIPSNQVGLKTRTSRRAKRRGFIIPLNQVGLKKVLRC